MAYDEDLAERIREVITASHEVTEQKMFGGLVFLIGGHISVASGSDGFHVRVNPEQADRLVATTNAEEMEMGGRTMRCYLRVPVADVRTKPQLRKWVDLGANYAASLPPTPAKKPKRKKS